MIMGECAYDDCDHPLMLPISDPPGVRFERHDCEGCGRPMWTRHSRIDPWSMTEADFLASYKVDHEAKTIKPKPGVEV